MNLIHVFLILTIHWFADFVCQRHKDAVNKSSSNAHLRSHVGEYTSIMSLGLWLSLSIMKSDENLIYFYPMITLAWFYAITFVVHFCTDYVTSRWSKYLREKEDYHNFFVVIGFDQLLHYVQLFVTAKYFYDI